MSNSSETDNRMMELAERIYRFIDKYAVISPDYNGHNEKYTNYDVRSLLACADMLSKGEKPKVCASSWKCSCAYEPRWSKEGEAEHDEMMREIYKIIESN